MHFFQSYVDFVGFDKIQQQQYSFTGTAAEADMIPMEHVYLITAIVFLACKTSESLRPIRDVFNMAAISAERASSSAESPFFCAKYLDDLYRKHKPTIIELEQQVGGQECGFVVGGGVWSVRCGVWCGYGCGSSHSFGSSQLREQSPQLRQQSQQLRQQP
jgi:hypothetical protein